MYNMQETNNPFRDDGPKISIIRVVRLTIDVEHSSQVAGMTLRTTAKELHDNPNAVRARLHKMLDDLLDSPQLSSVRAPGVTPA